jgi:hypothetical protein
VPAKRGLAGGILVLSWGGCSWEGGLGMASAMGVSMGGADVVGREVADML